MSIGNETIVEFDAQTSTEGRRNTKEYTDKLYRHVVKNYGKGTWLAGVRAAAHETAMDGPNQTIIDGHSVAYLNGNRNLEMTGGIVWTISACIERARMWKNRTGHGPDDRHYSKHHYDTVMDGMQSLREWQVFKRLSLLHKALRSIRPSNSSLSLCANISLVKDYALTGIKNNWGTHNRYPSRHAADLYGYTENKFLCLNLQSNWLDQWALKPDSHESLPKSYMFVGAADTPHLHGRKTSEVRYVKSMSGSRYTEGVGHVCKWNGTFIVAQTRRALENAYLREITATLVEARHSDVVKASKADHGGSLDSLTKKSLDAAVMVDALAMFKDGVSSTSDITG